MSLRVPFRANRRKVTRRAEEMETFASARSVKISQQAWGG